MIADDIAWSLVLEPDGPLVYRARRSNRMAFGVLYLRHHDAAWRVANAVSAFSPAAASAVVDAFTAVLSGLPRRPGDGFSLRPHLLRQVRLSAVRLGDGGLRATPDVLPPHASAAAVLRWLPEPERTALWLADVESLTPREAAVVMDVEPGRGCPPRPQWPDLLRGPCLRPVDAAPHAAPDAAARSRLSRPLARRPPQARPASLRSSPFLPVTGHR